MKKLPKILFISSSGGHLEELLMLKPLISEFDGVLITEKTAFDNNADYELLQTGQKDYFVFIKLIINFILSFIIFAKERPAYVVSTGTLIFVPFALLAKAFNCKIIYIETFARINDKTKTGSLIYHFSDLFIVQWESLLEVYPKAIYGGSIF